MARRHAGDVLDVLHEHRHAREQARVLACADPAVDLRRRPARALRVEVGDRVQLRRGDRRQ
ncbi:MAG: hypothetical protein WEE64_15215 [Dehalococcoidia bacterium]